MNHSDFQCRPRLRAILAAALLAFAFTIDAGAQPAQPGPGGEPRGRPGRGPSGPGLSPEQMALVEKFNTTLAAEAAAVSKASSNLVAATFTIPTDAAGIASANDALARARAAWARKASAEFARIQASDQKLGDAAIRGLVNSASGASRPGRGPGGPGADRRPPGGPTP